MITSARVLQMPSEGYGYPEVAKWGSRCESLAFHYVRVRLVTAQAVKEDHNNLSTTSNRYFLAYLKAISLGLIKHRTNKSAGPSGRAV